ncbi:MAG: ABC transporter permease [Chloroflexota bacterium]
MLTYIFRRIMIIPLIMVGISIMIFTMLSLLSPYERAALYIKEGQKHVAPIEDIVEKYDLDAPIHIQYWNWMIGKEDPDTGEIKGGVLRGDLGWSQAGKSTVAEAIGRRFPASAELALWSAVPMVSFGIWMGIKAAANQNKLTDQILRVLAIAGWSIPTFVLGLLLLKFFYSEQGLFPPGRLSIDMKQVVLSDAFVQYTKMHTIDALLNLRLDVFFDAGRHLVLPVVTLSVMNWAFLLRVTRSAMLDTLRQDYIVTARSKGLPEDQVINKHAVPNALVPVVTIGGLTMIGLFNAAVITETIFNFPGLGSFLVASMLDSVTLLGLTMFISLIFVFGNLIVDVLYGIVDPRIRLGA